MSSRGYSLSGRWLHGLVFRCRSNPGGSRAARPERVQESPGIGPFGSSAPGMGSSVSASVPERWVSVPTCPMAGCCSGGRDVFRLAELPLTEPDLVAVAARVLKGGDLRRARAARARPCLVASTRPGWTTRRSRSTSSPRERRVGRGRGARDRQRHQLRDLSAKSIKFRGRIGIEPPSTP